MGQYLFAFLTKIVYYLAELLGASMSMPGSPLPQPIETYPDHWIENIYPEEIGTDDPDYISRDIAERYLYDRYNNQPNDGLPPSWIRVPNQKSTWTFSRNRWLFGGNIRNLFVGDWKRAIAVSAASLALVNIIANREQIEDLFMDNDTPVESPAEQTAPRLPFPIKFPGIDVQAQEAFFQNDVGVETPRPNLTKFLSELKNLEENGANIQKIQIFGQASDEFLQKNNKGLEVTDIENHELALKRAERFKEDLVIHAGMQGIKLPPVEIRSIESVLNDTERKKLEDLAHGLGYANLAETIELMRDDPNQLPTAFRELLNEQIVQHRGVTAAILYKTKGIEFPMLETAGSDDDWRFLPYFIPPIPIPKRKWKTVFKEKYIPGTEPDDEWLRVYEEALNEDDTLKPDAWAYTRKYQALLREGRINQIYQANYHDVGGNDQILRVLFVDHDASPETLKAFTKLLQSLSQMQSGELANSLNAITVFPTENAGTESGNPKNIGLGIDYQDPAGVLGLAYPGLGLVEMHMPADPTPEELKSFLGPAWVFAHEALGHFGDLNGETPRLEPIDTRTRRYVMNSQWANSAESHYEELEENEKHDDRIWRIRRGVQTIPGDIAGSDTEVDDEDPRLHESLLIRVENRFPSQYSRTNPAELFAEGTAQAATGILIPFDQQLNFEGPVPSNSRFATAYAIGTRLLKIIVNRAGGISDADTLTFVHDDRVAESWQGQLGSIEDEELLLRPRTIEARTWDFRAPDDERVLNILVPRRR